MSVRTSRWVIVVAVPLLLALYASYPPVAVPVKVSTVTRKVARTPEEAAQHKVDEGQHYVASEQVTRRRFLPLALGRRDTVTRLVERRDDGTIVEELTTVVEGRVKLGLDIAGGTELLYQLKAEEGKELTGQVGTTIDILKKRIDPSNVKEYRIQPLENDRILIQVPRATATEVEQLKGRLERMGRLEFKLAMPRLPDEPRFAQAYAEAEQGRVPEGYTRMYVGGDPEQEFHLVRKGDPEITGEYLDPGSLQPTTDSYGFRAVGFRFNAAGARRFAKITEANRGWGLAIVLDGVLKSAPYIRERILGAGEISGRFTQEEVSDMINVLRAGSLPMDIELLQESTVGPQLGRDSIQKGLTALAVAGILVLAFIGVYYLRCGLVADAALILNLVLLLGVLCLLGAALTLPGMAAVLLTVGMAVDANVLIFERIREESAAGKSTRIALRNGYERAFTTIVDANVTTLLTAVILYLVGTGPVRGFAVILSFGILLSMFTALVVTRLAFETMIDRGWLKQFKMRSVMGKPAIDFARIRKPAYLASTAVVVIGLLAFFSRGSDLYDVDFTGGSLIHLSLAEPTPVGEVRDMLAESGFSKAEVQGVQTAAARGGGLTDFAIRIKGTGVDTAGIEASVRTALTAAGAMGEGDAIELTDDKQALLLKVSRPVTEERLREALSQEGDLWALPGLGEIVPEGDVRGAQVKVQVRQAAFGDERDLWARTLRALSWAGLARDDYTIESAQRADTPSGAALRIVLDKPLQAEVLMVELARRDFAQLDVSPAGAEGREFVLTADAAVVSQFETELPAGSGLQSVPRARIEGRTVSATLAKEFAEQDVRAFLEQQGFSDVYVMLDAPATEFRLNFSAEPFRQKMQSIFGPLARRGVGVTWQVVEDGPGAGDVRTVRMKLDSAVAFAEARGQLEAAGVDAYAEDLVVGLEDYSPETLVSELTLTLPADRAEEMQGRIAATFGQAQPVQKVVRVGPTVAEEMQGRALLAVIFASVIIVLYVAVRFHALRFGVAAVIALAHDILITAGLIALADRSGVMGDVKLNLAMLAAFLTVLGYSLNDTIVVFDRIRENMATAGRRLISAELINRSINQTLSRTILTSLTTLTVVVVLYLVGGPVLQGLALTLIIGVVVGTYSSMFIASPILLDWGGLTGAVRRVLKAVFLPVRLPFKLIAMLLGAGR